MSGATESEAAELRRRLSAATFLGALRQEALQALIKRGIRQHFAKGRMIVARGDGGDSLLLILSGEVKVSTVTADGHEVALNFLGPDDALGEIAVLDGGERTADATALSDVEAFVLQRRDVMPALLAEPEALNEVIALLCGKLRAASEQIEDNALDMGRRMARGLMRLMRQHGRRGPKGTRLAISPSQRDIGLFTGLSRENVSRQMSALREAGIIAVEGTEIMILDDKRLLAVAEQG
jgi:CRP/FNR family transcriptional regulator, cyclic AMP receptor protein